MIRYLMILCGCLFLVLNDCSSPENVVPPAATPLANPTNTSAPTRTAVPAPTATHTPAPTPTRSPGTTRFDPLGIEQVWVSAGLFSRGTADIEALNPPAWAGRELASEQPQHEVEITNGYWLDMFEVTNEAYEAFVVAGGYLEERYWSAAGWEWLQSQNVERLPRACVPDAAPDQPRVCVTWFEAEAYAAWRGGRLPTEAEWEYAARGPDSLIYPWGDMFEESLANVVDSEGLTAVGSYPEGVSWVMAHDMAGNAMEWVQDWLDWDYYELQERLDPQGPPAGSIKIEKGGWWGSNPYVARSAYRHFEDPPTYQDHHIDFRIVTVEDQQ